MVTRTADIIVAVILMAVGLLVTAEALRLGAGWGLEGPKAGFFPFLMSVLVVGGTIIIIRQAIRGTASVKGDKRFVLPGGLRPVITVFVPAALMVVLTEIVGLYIAAMIYLIGYIRWIGGYRWTTVLPIGILIPVAFYIVFDRIFLIPLPMGLLGAKLIRF